MFDHDPPWLPLYLCEAVESYAASRGVSEIARSGRGFLTAYKVVSGEPNLLGRDPHSGKHWTEVRRLFINRSIQAAKKGREKMWLPRRKGEIPSRRHLALAMWGYSPTPRRLRNWIIRSGHLMAHGSRE